MVSIEGSGSLIFGVHHQSVGGYLRAKSAMQRVGLRWGENIGLLGLDELEWAALAGVGITTLRQPTWQIGYAAVEQVVERIEGNSDTVRERVFSGELIVRGSTAR